MSKYKFLLGFLIAVSLSAGDPPPHEQKRVFIGNLSKKWIDSEMISIVANILAGLGFKADSFECRSAGTLFAQVSGEQASWLVSYHKRINMVGGFNGYREHGRVELFTEPHSKSGWTIEYARPKKMGHAPSFSSIPNSVMAPQSIEVIGFFPLMYPNQIAYAHLQGISVTYIDGSPHIQLTNAEYQNFLWNAQRYQPRRNYAAWSSPGSHSGPGPSAAGGNLPLLRL
ncbi:MAG: hypothetical protein V4534_02450 [Myxococcota bacterium]